MSTRKIETSWLAALLCMALIAVTTGAGRAAAAPTWQQAPERLAYGQTVEGTLTGDQPSAFYVFEAQAGDNVTITMIVTSGALDPFVVLSDASGALLATDDNSGGGLNARLSLTMPAAGEFTIQATSAGGEAPAEGGGFALNLTAAVGGAVEGEAAAGEEAEPMGEADAAPELSVRLAMLEPGLAVRDTLTRQIGVRYYWFRSEEAQPITVWPGPASSFDPLIVLYDAAFTPLQESTASAGLHAALPAPGIYFLAVALPDADSVGGEYGFTLEFGALPGSEGQFIPLVYGATESGAIEDTAPGETYEFRGSAGDEVTITMRRTAGDLDSYLSLLDAVGTLLFEDNDSGGSGDAQIVFTLPADGKYLIVASRMGQASGTTTGGYTLALESDAPAPPPDVEPIMPADYAEFPLIAFGETANGEISNEKHMDVYVFLGEAGETVTVEMDSMNPDEANGLDPFLVLLDDARIPLAEDDDIVDGQNRNAQIVFTLPRTAFYGVVATRFDQAEGTSAGPYTLTLRRGTPVETPGEEPGEEPVVLDALTPAPLTPGQPEQGTFERAVGVYSFSGSADALVDLSLTSDEGTEAVVILADENLNEIASGSGAALIGLTLPKTERYAVLVAPRFGPGSQAAGGYILALNQTSETGFAAQEVAAAPRDLVYGDVVNGEITDVNTSLLYHFSGRAGERVRITMEATPDSGLDPFLELHDAAGQVIQTNDDINPGVVRNSRISVELPADGAYTIVASRYSGDDMEPTSGAFELSLEQVENFEAEGVSQAITPIAYGETVYGEINDDLYLMFYVFDGTIGDVVTIAVDNTSGNLDSVLHLYRAAGDQWVEVANNDDSPTGGTYEAMLSNITLPETTKYLIAVSRYGLANEATFGAYSLTLTRQG